MSEFTGKEIYSVTALTRNIRQILEDAFPFVWVAGEISNHAVPVSGHSYFSLKDAEAVITCVMFKNQKRNLRFDLESGMKVFGMARLTVYEPRGVYQLIFEHLEPEGVGALQKAFEQLKARLDKEGFFDASRKKFLPYLPRQISVITSGTGAAVRDIIQVATRRFPTCCLQIIPVAVQGDAAANEVVYAIETANALRQSDILILARGGGSMEDLAAFNSESVARAIFASRIPVVTGIGHETDVTIADFVADVRAPTPSAAAEIVLPDKAEVTRRLEMLHASMSRAITRRVIFFSQKLDDLHTRLKSPAQVVTDTRQTLTCLFHRMAQAMTRRISHQRDRMVWLSATLDALGPVRVLNRGYCIARRVADQRIITDPKDVRPQELLELLVSQGRILTRVEETDPHGKNDI